MEWGNEIAVNGVRPDWLRDETVSWQSDDKCWNDGYSAFHVKNWTERSWAIVPAIRLPADHPYYLVERYNKQHGTSFVYWPGGDAAPADWDGGDVLRRDGFAEKVERRSARAPIPWAHHPTIGNHERYDIIGYTRRSEPTRDTVAVERRTAKDWCKYCETVTGSTYLTTDELELFKALGLVIETEAERIAAETGVPVETVQRVLDARQG